MGGPRAHLYSGAAAAELRGWLGLYEPDRPERADLPYFKGSQPQELLYEEIEAIWAGIAESDDWSAFEAKIRAIRVMGESASLA